MLFVAEYDLTWEMLEGAVAKRLEWADEMPAGFRFVGEYVWKDRDPPFRGIAIIEAESVEAMNSFVLHYGPALHMNIHPASDVLSAIAMTEDTSPPQTRKRRRR